MRSEKSARGGGKENDFNGSHFYDELMAFDWISRAQINRTHECVAEEFIKTARTSAIV
jgi:hypothetical protein